MTCLCVQETIDEALKEKRIEITRLKDQLCISDLATDKWRKYFNEERNETTRLEGMVCLVCLLLLCCRT